MKALARLLWCTKYFSDRKCSCIFMLQIDNDRRRLLQHTVRLNIHAWIIPIWPVSEVIKDFSVSILRNQCKIQIMHGNARGSWFIDLLKKKKKKKKHFNLSWDMFLSSLSKTTFYAVQNTMGMSKLTIRKIENVQLWHFIGISFEGRKRNQGVKEPKNTVPWAINEELYSKAFFTIIR